MFLGFKCFGIDEKQNSKGDRSKENNTKRLL